MTTTLRLDYIQIDRLLCSAGSEGGCHACYILLYLGHARIPTNKKYFYGAYNPLLILVVFSTSVPNFNFNPALDCFDISEISYK